LPSVTVYKSLLPRKFVIQNFLFNINYNYNYISITPTTTSNLSSQHQPAIIMKTLVFAVLLSIFFVVSAKPVDKETDLVAAAQHHNSHWDKGHSGHG